MFCATCGKEIHDEAVICVNCGCAVKKTRQSNVLDKPSAGMNILAFLIPIVGLILYVVWIEKTPKKAKATGKWALIGAIVGIVITAIGAFAGG